MLYYTVKLVSAEGKAIVQNAARLLTISPFSRCLCVCAVYHLPSTNPGFFDLNKCPFTVFSGKLTLHI